MFLSLAPCERVFLSLAPCECVFWTTDDRTVVDLSVVTWAADLFDKFSSIRLSQGSAQRCVPKPSQKHAYARRVCGGRSVEQFATDYRSNVTHIGVVLVNVRDRSSHVFLPESVSELGDSSLDCVGLFPWYQADAGVVGSSYHYNVLKVMGAWTS